MVPKKVHEKEKEKKKEKIIVKITDKRYCVSNERNAQAIIIIITNK